MSPGPNADFDVDVLYAALDAQRRSRALSWRGVVREMAGLPRNATAGGISASTLSGLRKRRAVEGDGVLQMLRWLGRTPESFVPGHPAPTRDAALPAVAPGRILRFDTRAIHAALDARRIARCIAWSDVAREIGGIAPACLTRLSKGGRTGFPHVMRIVRWLGRPAASFTRASLR